MLKILSFLALIVLQIALSPAIGIGQSGPTFDVAGRYSDGEDYAVYFDQTKYGLTIRPVMWTATQLLRETSKDRFEVVDRTSRTAEFTRGSNGKVTAVKITGMDGEGLKLVRATGPPIAIELFLDGRTRDAAAAYLNRGAAGAAKALEDAEQVLERLPTKTRIVVSFLLALKPRLKANAKLHELLGFAYVQSGDRRSALSSFRTAYALDPTSKDTVSGLARLGSLPASFTPSSDVWKIPFPLASVFAKPTAAEIRTVEDDWAARDLTPTAMKEELKSSVKLGDWRANIRIVSHLVHGSRHYGAIIYPDGVNPGTCPVIIVAKGVSPNYFPLDLGDTSDQTFMGDLSRKLIFVFPSFRGEVLNFEGRSFRSEGDRRDALDGATDDALALLNVTLATTPEADPRRICTYGQSRGGNVALLAGIRDPRIRCVVDLAGPTDWFYLMGTNGWTEQELWAEAVRTHANVEETGGQNLERFLMRAIEGRADLAAVRHNMIASSPIYFAKRLPQAQLHYGMEDPSVPVINGLNFVGELRRNKIPPSRYQAFFYPGQGHDTDRLAAPIAARAFISKSLNTK